MKKTYKLIKEYPGSPKIGFILNDSWKNNYGDDRYLINGLAFKPENYKEFWEEVIEKDYEILSLTFIKDDNWLHDLKRGQIVKCRSHRNGHLEFKTSKGWDAYSGVEGFQKIVSEVFSIHSVKRLSDGEIFTIGDNVGFNNHSGTAIIEEILIENNRLWLYFGNDSSCLLKGIKKNLKKPLFTTEDGVDIFNGDIFWNVDLTFYKQEMQITNDKYSKAFLKSDKQFSTKEKAEEYILLNKPCLSINDLNPIFQEKITIGYQSLIEVVKKKLNK